MAAIHATGKTSDAMATTTMAESPPSWDVAATETTSKKANALSSTTFPASILPAGASASSEEAFAASSLTNVIRKPTAPAISAHAIAKGKNATQSTPVSWTTKAIVADVGAHIMQVMNPRLRAEARSFSS